MKQKYCPLTRLTAVTGTVTPGTDRQTTRILTNCCSLMFAGTSRSSAFASTVCVAGSARGETNEIGLRATGLPSLSRISVARPTLSSGARSTGTWIYASRPAFSSMVVMTVEVVTRSPSRIAMSPTMPVVGAVTR